MAAFFATVRKVAEQLGLSESGYRVIFNHGPDADQTVHLAAPQLGMDVVEGQGETEALTDGAQPDGRWPRVAGRGRHRIPHSASHLAW